jgi:hypothetical protein
VAEGTIRGRTLLPTTEFSRLRRFTRIAECVMAVTSPCKSDGNSVGVPDESSRRIPLVAGDVRDR